MPDFSYARMFATLQARLHGPQIIQAAETYRAYPLQLGFSSYTAGMAWIAAQYEATGLETEVVRFPADGRTIYADRHFPLAWDVEEGWLEVLHASIPERRVADYARDPYGIVPFAADSGGVRDAVLVPESALRAGLRPTTPYLVLFNRYPFPAAVDWARELGCAGFAAAVKAQPDDAIAYDARKWFNDAFGEGHIDCRHQTLPAYSITPRQADAILRAWASSGPLPVRFLMRAQTYAGEAPVVTARIVGAELPEQEVWLSAHTFEPNATNNCAGVAMCLEAAAALMQAIESGALPRPRRTIRFLHGFETFGVYSYAVKHAARMPNVICGLSIDGIGSVDRNGVRERFCHVRNSTLHPSFAHALTHYVIAACARHLGVEFHSCEGSPTNDDVLNDPEFGPAWGLLYGEMYETAGYYHTNADTSDKLCPQRLTAGAAMEAAWACYVAQADTNEARSLATLSRNAALCWLTETCARALSIQQPSVSAAAARAERLHSYADLALAAGTTAIRSVLPLAAAPDRDALAHELTPLTQGLLQEGHRLTQTAVDSVRSLAEPAQPAAVTPDPTPVSLETKARKIVPRRRFPGHVGLGTISDEAREQAQALFGRYCLEYWSFDRLRFLWLDGQRSAYDAARAARAVGTAWELPESEEDWASYLRSFMDMVSLLTQTGHLTIRRQALLAAEPSPPAPAGRARQQAASNDGP